MKSEREVPSMRPRDLLENLIKAKGLHKETAQPDGACVAYGLMSVYDPAQKISVCRWSVCGTNEHDTHEAIEEGVMTLCAMMAQASADDTIPRRHKTVPIAFAIVTYGRARQMTESDGEPENLSDDEIVAKFAKEIADSEGSLADEVATNRARVVNVISMEGTAHQGIVFHADGTVLGEQIEEQWLQHGETPNQLESGGDLDDGVIGAFSLLVMCATIVIDGKELSQDSITDLACQDEGLPTQLRTRVMRATFMTATECGEMTPEHARRIREVCADINPH